MMIITLNIPSQETKVSVPRRKVYCSRSHDRIRLKRYHWYGCNIHKRVYYCYWTFIINSELNNCFIEHQHLWPLGNIIDFFSSLLSITSLVKIVFVLILVLVSWYHYIQILLSALIETLTLSCFYCLFECIWW